MSNGASTLREPLGRNVPFCAPGPEEAEVEAVKLSCVENLTASAGVPKSTTAVVPDLMTQAPEPSSVARPPEKRAWIGGVPTTKKSAVDLKSNVSVTVTGGGGAGTEGL